MKTPPTQHAQDRHRPPVKPAVRLAVFKLAVILLLVVAPFLALLGAGFLWFRSMGWTVWFAYGLAACWGLAFLLERFWPKRTITLKQPVFGPDGAQNQQDADAWKIVASHGAALADREWVHLTNPDWYAKQTQTLACRLAKHYRGIDSTSAEDALTVPELLAVTEHVCHDLYQIVDENIPFCHRLTWGQIRRGFGRAEQTASYSSVLSKLWTVYRLFNPANWIAIFFQKLVSDSVMKDGKKATLDYAIDQVIRTIGEHLIEAYSGRYAIGKTARDDLASGTSLTADQPLGQPPQPLPPLSVLLLGQGKAGKSSLINRLAGQTLAMASAVKPTQVITAFPHDLDGIPLQLLDTVGYGLEGFDERQLTAVCDTAQRADMLLFVVRADNAGRAYDLRVLEQVRGYFRDRPRLNLPPILAVLTRIDDLSPIREWSPPYDWEELPPASPDESVHLRKARAIHQAVAFVQREMSLQDQQVIPVCLVDPPFGVDTHLLPAMLAAVDEAKRAVLVRAMIQRADAQKSMWSDVLRATALIKKSSAATWGRG